MAVPWRCRSGCVVRYASVTLRCVAVALRVLRCVALRVLCSLRGGCASFQAVLSRFGWLFPAAPGLSVLVPCYAELLRALL